MKKIYLIVIMFSVLSIGLCSQASAVMLPDSESLWVRVDSVDAFDGMSMFYGTTQQTPFNGFEYNVWAPVGFSGSAESNAFSADLSCFYGQSVLFQFIAPSGAVTFQDNAWVWDSGIVNGMNGLSGGPFAMAYYDLDNDGTYLQRWLDREVIDGYKLASILDSEPAHGNLFFHQDVNLTSGSNYYIRSDFIRPVPEPCSALLMAIGLLGIGIHRRRK